MISTPVFSLIKYERKVGVKKDKNSGIRKVKRIKLVYLKHKKSIKILGGIIMFKTIVKTIGAVGAIMAGTLLGKEVFNEIKASADEAADAVSEAAENAADAVSEAAEAVADAIADDDIA